MEEILVYFAIVYGGDWDKIYEAINKKERVDKEKLDAVLSENKNSYITLLSSDYPERLKNIYKPPFVLFYKGDISLLKSEGKFIAVVGSRLNSSYGRECTLGLVTDLVKKDCLIVSGLAKGIDALAHKTCLDMNGKTIAVLGNGVDAYYPYDNKDLQDEIFLKGLVISEYPGAVSPSKVNFPRRNRIVAGLSDGVLVCEAKRNSGALITASRALEMGKEVFCVPYKMGSESACNKLIKEGARLVESGDDILSEL